ncbi:MAG: hypothetical protein AAGD01_16050 [Acidobacteriota bacterium]
MTTESQVLRRTSPARAFRSGTFPSLLWHLLPRAARGYLFLAILVTGGAIPTYWSSAPDLDEPFSLTALLVVSLPLLIGCASGISLQMLQRVTHQHLWSGYRAGIRRDGWSLALLALTVGLLGSFLSAEVSPFLGASVALAIFALGLIPYPNVLVAAPALAFAYFFGLFRGDFPWLSSPSAAALYLVGGLLLIRLCLSDFLFRQVVTGPAALATNPESWSTGPNALATMRGHWRRGHRKVEIAGAGESRRTLQWLRAAAVERFGSHRFPWLLPLLVLTVPMLFSLIAVSALRLHGAGQLGSGAAWAESLTRACLTWPGDDEGTQSLLAGFWISMMTYVTVFAAPFTRSLLYPLGRRDAHRAAFVDALVSQAQILAFLLVPVIALGNGIRWLVERQGGELGHNVLWAPAPFPATLMFLGLPLLLGFSYSYIGRPNDGKCGKFKDKLQPALLVGQGLLLIAGLLFAGITQEEGSPLPWSLAFQLTLFCTWLLTQALLWLQLRTVYRVWNRA